MRDPTTKAATRRGPVPKMTRQEICNRYQAMLSDQRLLLTSAGLAVDGAIAWDLLAAISHAEVAVGDVVELCHVATILHRLWEESQTHG